MDVLRRYYTGLLSGPPDFSWAQERAVAFRKTLPTIPGFLPRHVKALGMAPLLYKFPKDVESTDTVRKAAQVMMTSVLAKGVRVEKTMREFLDAFQHFAEKDAKELRESLFRNRYELSQIADTESLVDKLKEQITRLGWEPGYVAFSEKRRREALDRLVETMDRAFWDSFQQSLLNEEYDRLTKTLEEIHTLMLDIPHPLLSDRGREYLDELFSASWGADTSVPEIKVWFLSVLRYLRECDSVAMEPVYDTALAAFWEQERIEFVVSALQTVYALLIQLRAKIRLLILVDYRSPVY